MTEETAKPRSSDFVQSLERGLAVIRAFDADHAELTLSDVARATDLTRAAARRFLHTLVDLGYVRTDGRLFALRPRVLELGYSFLSSMSLPELALPHMEQLSATIRESCSVAVLDSDDIVYVARVVTRRIMTVAINVGTRFPAYATSMGRVLLAHQPDEWLEHYLSVTQLDPITPKTVTKPAQLRRDLERVRAQGYCVVDQELEIGLRSMAVPIRAADGQVVAAMNVSLHVSRGSIDAARREMLPLMQDCARAIEADFGMRDRSRQKG